MEDQNKEGFFDKYSSYIFIAILLLSFYLRLRYFNINTAIWYDEGSYLNMAKRIGLGMDYLNDDYYFRRTFFLPLLFALIYKIFGNAEILLRISELIFSTATVIFTYLLIKEMFDKKYALISSFVLAVSWLHLFFTSRLLTNGPDLFFITAGLYFFWRGYANNKSKLNIYLAGLFFGLGIFTRFASSITLIPLLIYVLTKEKLGFIKNRQLWVMFFIIMLILTPFFIKFFSYEGAGSGVGGFLKHYFLDRDILIFNYILDLGYILKGMFLLLLIIGLTYFIDLFLGFDLIFKDENIRKKLFILAWLLLPLIIFGLITSVVEERYLMLTMPFLSFLIAHGCLSLEKYLKINKIIIAVIILALLVIGAYSQLSVANNLINDKKDSFIQLRYAGEWLKQNTGTTDYIISSGQPQLMYYSERNIESFTSNENEFQMKIDRLKPKYMILTKLEPSPDWTYAYPQKNQEKLKPVMAYFFDKEQQQPAVIIYEFIYNSIIKSN